MASGEADGRMTEIRELANHAEYADAIHLQRIIWGWQDLDILPLRFFVVAKSIGGHLLGAFDGDYMFGFCLAIPGVKPDGSIYLHSHMLGVLPEYQDSDAGHLLKTAQKDAALVRGIRLIEWTFDLLELKNAYFNIEKLGVVVRQYVPNLYGSSTSRLQSGLQTDRLVAEWHIARGRVTPVIEARVPIPSDISEIKRSDPELARGIQSRIRLRFQELLADGLSVAGFERSQESGVYLFGRLDY